MKYSIPASSGKQRWSPVAGIPEKGGVAQASDIRVNQPEYKSGRWGVGLTAAKMTDCRWLKPVLVGQFEFLEWTGDHHLRHSKFIALREDKKATDVRRE
jgi:ATP-dependent DNA ligase